jgi:CARDB
MRFYATFIVAVLCATCVGAAVASEPISTAGAKRAAVRVLSCDRSGRQAIFRGAMRRVGGTGRMSMRFTLLQRDPGERFRRVRAPGLSRWKRSRFGVRRFAHRQRVRGLTAGSDYRARVDFRWYDGDGDVIRRRRLTSRTCSLAELLPNLQVTSITGVPAGAGEQYAVRVKNAGEMDSPESGLRLGVDGKAPRFASVPGLAPGETATVSLSGERCIYGVRATADPGQQIPESREGDNSLFHGCP